MHEQAIAIYCVCEEIVRFFGLIDDSQCKMTTSEVMGICFDLSSKLPMRLSENTPSINSSSIIGKRDLDAVRG